MYLLASIFALTALFGSACHAAPTVAAILQEYQLVDTSQCRKPAAMPPPAIKETYETFNLRRRLIDLDGSGNCVLMEFWVERLGGSPARGMRSLQHRFMRQVNGKWQPFESALEYFPYTLKSAKSGQVFFVVAPHRYDINDMVFSGMDEVYLRKGWRNATPGSPDDLELEPVSGQRGLILQALAVHLARGLPGAKGDTRADRERIKRLLGEVRETVPKADQTMLNPAGDLPLPGQ